MNERKRGGGGAPDWRGKGERTMDEQPSALMNARKCRRKNDEVRKNLESGTMRRPNRPRSPALVAPSDPAILWGNYDRIEPGVYRAYCRCAKHYRDPGFKRWTCLLRFDVFSPDITQVPNCVPFWMSLGSGVKPRAGRRGRYFKEWVRANGEPPARQDRLSPNVFTARMAHIEIGDTKGDAPYSVVRKIISWETGPRRVTRSASHTVKEGKGERTSDE
jgi:hypothetical protein